MTWLRGSATFGRGAPVPTGHAHYIVEGRAVCGLRPKGPFHAEEPNGSRCVLCIDKRASRRIGGRPPHQIPRRRT